MFYTGRIRAGADGRTITGVNTLWGNDRVKVGQLIFPIMDSYETILDTNPTAIPIIQNVISNTSLRCIQTLPVPLATNDVVYYLIADSVEEIKQHLGAVKVETSFDLLYTIYLNDDQQTVLRFTDRPSADASGFEYPPNSGHFYTSVGITYNNIVKEIGGEIESVEIIMENLTGALYEYFLSGKFRRAVITIMGVYRWTSEDYNNFLMSGYVDQIKPDEVEIEFLVINVADLYKINMRTFGAECQFNFWHDTRCGIQKSAVPVYGQSPVYQVHRTETTAGVLSLSSTVDFPSSGELDFSEVMLYDNTHKLIRYLHGVKWTRNTANAKRATLTVRFPLRLTEMPDDNWYVHIRRDCDRSFKHCQRHNNVSRFGGFSMIATEVKMMSSTVNK